MAEPTTVADMPAEPLARGVRVWFADKGCQTMEGPNVTFSIGAHERLVIKADDETIALYPAGCWVAVHMLSYNHPKDEAPEPLPEEPAPAAADVAPSVAEAVS